MENQTIETVEHTETIGESERDVQTIENVPLEGNRASDSVDNPERNETQTTEDTTSSGQVVVQSNTNESITGSTSEEAAFKPKEKKMNPEEIEMTESDGETGPIQASVVCKEEPTDVDMEMAEDFTRETPSTTAPISVKQEKPSYQDEIKKEREIETQAIVQIANSSLSLLSQYISSDSESDSNITDSEEELSKETYTVAGMNSSTDSSDDEVECLPNTAGYREQTILVSDTETLPNGEQDGTDKDISSSDDEEPNAVPAPVKAKGELLIHELPPIEELHITVPENACKPVGQVQSIVAQIVIVQSYPGIELFNLDTVLFLEKGKRPLGKIFDVIGQVAAPMYCVLFNSRQEVVNKRITVGTLVYCAPQTEHTSFIILSDLMRQRGSDASWLDDHEAPDYALDYSDDEEERRARGRNRTSSGRQTPDGGGGGGAGAGYSQPFTPRYRGRGRGRGNNYRGHHSGHSWHQMNPQFGPPQHVLNPFAVRPGFPPYFPPPQGPPFN